MSQFTQVHSSKKYRLGTRKKDVAGNEYVYLKGVASLAQYDWVTFAEDYTAVRSAANAKGQVAIAQAAVDAATKFGWFMIAGTSTGNVATGADNAQVWLTATAGRVDNTDVAGDFVSNAIQRSATASNLATFQIFYPFVHDAAID